MTLERCSKCHELIDPVESVEDNICLDCKHQQEYEKEQLAEYEAEPDEHMDTDDSSE